MKTAKRWFNEDFAEFGDEEAMVYVIKAIQLDAINAAADLVRDTKEEGAEELATAIIETLTRSMQ